MASSWNMMVQMQAGPVVGLIRYYESMTVDWWRQQRDIGLNYPRFDAFIVEIRISDKMENGTGYNRIIEAKSFGNITAAEDYLLNMLEYPEFVLLKYL